PFGWQLLFFTGFAFMTGWLPAPPVSRTLVIAAAAFLILTAPIGSWKVFTWINDAAPDLGAEIRKIWRALRLFDQDTGFSFRDKTDFGILRYIHFLSLAYLAWVAAGVGGARLVAVAEGALGRATAIALTIISKVGQQSLAVFVFSMAVARILGFVLDQIGRTPGTFALINLTGFAMIIAVAYMAGWFKSQPWRSKRA
ncbi:MAG: OpgC domain-containing protein, partial [Sedimentitalea sp.]